MLTYRLRARLAGLRRLYVRAVCKSPSRDAHELENILVSESEDVRELNAPIPNQSGLRKIILFLDEPDMPYTARMHALNATSSVIGA